MDTKADKAAAERDRKARIKRAHDHLAALPDDDRAAVIASAEEKEGDAREQGSRRAHVAFVEDALVAWHVGGEAIAAAEAGKPLTPAAIDKLVDKASRTYRGDTATEELRGDLREMLAGATTTPAAEPLDVQAAAQAAVDGAKRDLAAEAVALRAKGLTVAEVAAELKVTPGVARELCGDAKRGTGKATKTAAPRAKRAAREVRTHRGHREEKCPECQEWRPAEQDGDGKYAKAADFREGRHDCRACYNTRWLEGKKRREAARAAK